MEFVYLLSSKELSYNEIKDDDEIKKIEKPDYSTKFLVSRKNQCAKFFPKKSIGFKKVTIIFY